MRTATASEDVVVVAADVVELTKRVPPASLVVVEDVAAEVVAASTATRKEVRTEAAAAAVEVVVVRTLHTIATPFRAIPKAPSSRTTRFLRRPPQRKRPNLHASLLPAVAVAVALLRKPTLR